MEVDQALSQAEQADKLAGLLLKHLRQEINAQEQQQLNNWIAEHPSHKRLFDRINNEQHLLQDLQSMQRVDREAWWQEICRQTIIPQIKKRPFYRRWLFYAMIIFLLVVAGFFIRSNYH